MMIDFEQTEMFVAGIVLDPSNNAPIVILKDNAGKVCMPIWIGVNEANAIASALKKMEISRPMTHDLLKSIIDEFGAKIQKVLIRSLEDNTFYADIELLIGATVKTIDARPSDALALAIKSRASIFVAKDVLAQSQVSLVAVNSEDMDKLVSSSAEQDFANNANFVNIEREKWQEILAEMDPEDFRYKM